MAQNSSSKTTKTTWSLNKISMYTIIAVAVLYLISMILSLVGVNSKIVGALQGIATAVMVCITAVLAWRYVKNKQAVWKILYVVCLLLVVVGVIIPLVV
jgi:hypothetical protein